MTPSETHDNSRKLLQMKTAGSTNPLMQRRVKDDIDIKTKQDYVSQLKEDPRGLEQWSKSFGEAINTVTVDNKQYLENVATKMQKIFMKIGSLKKKTVIFGLDSVLVKTSFEKEGPEWKPSKLILDPNRNLKMDIFVAVRPFAISTLKQLKRAGMEIILYTSSQYNYTTAIMKVLSKLRVDFHHIITAEDHDKATEQDGEGRPLKKIATKNINILLHNRNPKDIIVVDSKVRGFAYNITNGVYVPPFEGPPTDKNPNPDNFFMHLFDYLKTFNDVDDVRKKIQREFDIKKLFISNFKNPAMDKLKSLMNTQNSKKEVEAKNSTPKIETSFRRNSRANINQNDLLKLQKLNSQLKMDPIKEVQENV